MAMTRKRMKTLPLGIDYGRSRIRVALTTVDSEGTPKLEAVAARDVLDDPVAALREARTELQTRERRCVIGISRPEALVRLISLPKMSRFERRRAAVFQAARYIDYPVTEAAISLTRLENLDRWALGVARRSALHTRVAAARSAGLVPLAVDDVAFALDRALRDADGTIDITDDTTRLTLFSRPVPYISDTPIGAMFLTEGIARSLGIDARTAEDRKRTVGFAGAGEAQRDALISAISILLASARDAGNTGVGRLLMIGNGSRVPGLPEAIERATGYAIRLAGLESDVSDTLPPDVLRAAGADWSIAFGLSLWYVAS
jgi:type IV pilus assembly protein PilM